VNRKRSGLTVIEILVVVGIIALLAGMLIPAASTVRKMAKEVKQRAQLTAIELGLAAFKNDYGDYPPSDPYSWLRNVTDVQNSSGAQKLAEALGLGFPRRRGEPMAIRGRRDAICGRDVFPVRPDQQHGFGEKKRTLH